MGKQLKQFFSLFLVLMLLVGMIPNVHATYGASAETTSTGTSTLAEPAEDPTAPIEPVETESASSDVTLMAASEDDYTVMSIASTQSGILLFDYSDNGDYTSRLNSQISIYYKVNGSGTTRIGYLKNIGWHFPRYNNTPYPDHTLYCIEPYKNYGASTSGNSVDRGVTLSGSGSTTGSTAWYTLSESRRNAIGLILLYSDQLWDDSISVTTTPKASNPNVPLRVATQFLIYEIVCGLRDPDTFIQNSKNECGTAGNILYNAGDAAIGDFASNYNNLVSLVQDALKRPSFTSASSSTAPALALTGEETVMTDTNGVLSDWTFTDGNGAEFARAGNNLYIYQVGDISSDTVFKATKTMPSAANTTYSLWYMQGGSYQTTISLYSPSTDTMNAYFKLDPPATAALVITKTTETGENLDGWEFGIYSNSSCTNLISGPHTTDTSGNICITGLSAGTYYAKELGHTDSTINSRYTCDSTNPQKVTLVSGETTTVSFYNKLAASSIKLIKTTNTGKNLDSWQIGVYTDSSCTSPIVGSPFTTSEDGTFTVTDLQAGTYYAKELAGSDDYWEFDPDIETVTVEAGETAEVTFSNIHYGRIEFRKTTNTGNQLDGWTFRVKDYDGNVVGEYTTDENGYACTENLPLGRYIVVELPTEDNYWNCELGFHDVTVKAGETVVDEWLNREQGLGWFHKSTNTGESLEGWIITIYSDEACTTAVSTVTTGSEGKIGLYLDPGIYYAKETGDTEDRFENEYWLVDETVQMFEIKAHEDTDIYFNNIYRGNVLIKKEMPDGGSVAGWMFDIHRVSDNAYLGAFTSADDGTILTGFLEPGEYRITEQIPEGSLYVCDGENPKTVSVEAGKTAEVTFFNVLRPGEISIQKVDPNGNPLSGAEFLLEWSEDGQVWAPVVYTNTMLVAGGTCTSEGLEDGKLVSGEDGVVTFTDLLPGCWYRLVESKAPEGYQLLSEYAYKGILANEENNMITLKVVNAPVYKLPQTGSKSPVIMIVSLGVALAGCAGAIIFLRKRKNW